MNKEGSWEMWFPHSLSRPCLGHTSTSKYLTGHLVYVPLSCGEKSEGDKWFLLSRNLYLSPSRALPIAGNTRGTIHPTGRWPIHLSVKESRGVGEGGENDGMGKNIYPGDDEDWEAYTPCLRCSSCNFWGKDEVPLRISVWGKVWGSIVWWLTKSKGGGSRPAPVWILVLPLTGCEALSK